MSKMWAKVSFKNGDDKKKLIGAFFEQEYFNPCSSINIKGEEAKLEIVFRESPVKIIDAIIDCKVEELYFGKILKNYEVEESSEQPEQEVETELESSEQPEQEVATELESSEQLEQEVATKLENSEQLEQEVTTESESSEQLEQEVETELESSEQPEQEVATELESSEQLEQEVVTEIESSEQLKRGIGGLVGTKKETSKTELNPVVVSKLEEIAKISTSYSNFVSLISEWLEMGSLRGSFIELEIASTEVDKITWRILEKTLKNKGVRFTTYEKMKISTQVSEKLKEYAVTIIPLTNKIREYKYYHFKDVENCLKNEEVSQELEEVEEPENCEEKVIPKPRVRMNCMPEIEEFEETLASVDKTQPIEDRIRHVLSPMGLNERPLAVQKDIVDFVSKAITKGNNAFNLSNIDEHLRESRMSLATMLRNYVLKFDSRKMVKLRTFLSELQPIILFESEIRNVLV